MSQFDIIFTAKFSLHIILKEVKRMGKQTRSSVAGGGTRVTTEKSGGGSEDRTYDSSGKLVDITDHERDGSSHSHEIGRGGLLGAFGPFKGSKK